MIRVICLRVLAGMMLLAVAAPAQVRVRFECKRAGRYMLWFPGHGERYCWDKTLYTWESAPAEVRSYFAAQQNQQQEVRDADARYQQEFRARFEARKRAEAAANGTPAVSRAATPAPAPPALPPVALERLRAVRQGMDRSELQAAVGRPHARISGSEERLTYMVEGGGQARIVVSEGKVTSIQLPDEH